jgi:hypothetical protein
MEMIKANMDESVMIKEINRNAIHVRLTKISVRPGREKYPSTAETIKCYPIATFEKLEALRYAKSPMVWYTTGGFDEMKIVHDGRLENMPEVIAQTNDEKLAQQRERRKQDRMKNLALARAKKAANNA